MHDVMNIESSHFVDFDQFHMKAVYIVPLSCSMLKIKFKRCYLGANFDDLACRTKTSPIMMQNKTSDLKTLTLMPKTYTLIIIRKKLVNPKF